MHAAIVLFALIGCEQMGSIGRNEAVLPNGPVPIVAELTGRPLCDSIADQGLTIDLDTRATLVAALGQPDSVAARVELNRHDRTITDSIIVVQYAALGAQYRKPGGGNDLLERLTVRDNGVLRYPKAGIGTSPEGVKTMLGQPAEESANALTYHCSAHEVGTQPLMFHFENGAVQNIELNFYVD